MTSWQTLSLGSFITFQRGYDLPHQARKNGVIPIVSSAGVTDFHSVAMVNAPGVVTGRYGTIGQLFYVDQPFWPLNTTLYVRDFQGNHPKFAYYFLQRFNFHSFSGKSGVPGVNRNDLHSETVSIPAEREEQRAIATVLSDVDALIAGLEKLIAKKRDLKQAAMQQLLTGQTRLPGFSGEWAVKNLGDLGLFLKGTGVRKDEASTGSLPCVRYGELYTHHSDVIRSFNSWISPEVARSAVSLKTGDLLFAGSGETKEEIGKCAAYIGDGSAFAGGDIVIFRPTNVDPIFMGYTCNTKAASAQKASLGQGDAVVHISATSLASIKIKLPKVEEQTAIATVLSDMDTELSALESRLAKTRDLKQGMMQELLTGRTRLI